MSSLKKVAAVLTSLFVGGLIVTALLNIPVGAQPVTALSVLQQILAAVQGSIPSGSNNIGNVNGANNVTPTDCSTTITTGGTAQVLIVGVTTLHGFTVVNIDSTTAGGEPLWISLTGTATANATSSYPLVAPSASFAGMGSFTTPVGFGTNHAVSILGATTGHKVSCTLW